MRIVTGGVCLGLGLAFAMAGCAVDTGGAPEADSPEATSASMEPILGGVPAVPYPEAAALNMVSNTGAGFACSATVISPHVVLTAGHCVDGMKQWGVVVGTTYRASSHAETFDWAENGAQTVNPNHHDIGLVYLTDPIALAHYPTLADTPIADGTKVQDVGRIVNGTLTSSLYMASVAVSAGSAVGFPFDYVSNDVIEHGDSGGPVFQDGTHNLVAVNSGAGGGTQVLARVDLLVSWIRQRVANAEGANSGPPDAGAAPADAGAKVDAAPPRDAAAPPADAGKAGDHEPDAGTKPADAGTKPADAGSTAPPDASPPPPPPPAAPDAGTSPTDPGATCPKELEPNDTVAKAQSLTTQVCGALGSASDTDWYVFGARAGTTRVELTGSGNATFQIGFANGPSCIIALSNQRAVGIKVDGGTKGICLRVASATHATQSYRITKTP